MEKNEALILLGCDPKSDIDHESIEIALEEAIFKEASFFMRRIYIPKLAEARIYKLTKLSEAANCFGIAFPERGEPVSVEAMITGIHESGKIIEVVQQYQQHEMDLKLSLSNVENPQLLIGLYEKWNALYAAYSNRFIFLFENLDIALPMSEIQSGPITQTIDYIDLLTELRRENYFGAVQKEYMRLRKMAKSS